MSESADFYEAAILAIADRPAALKPKPADDLLRAIYRENLGLPRTGARALDFGCGGGRHTEYLLDLGYQVSATDISRGTIEATRRRIEPRQADLRLLKSGDPLPFEAGIFSVIVAWEVCHWLADRELYLRYVSEFRRTLTDTGTLIITMPSERHYLLHNATKVADDTLVSSVETRIGMQFYAPTRNALVEQFSQARLSVARTMIYEYGDAAIADTVGELVRNDGRRQVMAVAAAQVCDGRGARRVARELAS